MKENLMQTQTGGTGETVQLQTQPTPSAENFDVKINPPVDSEPAQPTQPTEPVKPVATVPTQQEAQQQAILPTAPVEETVPVQPVDDLEAIFNDDEIVKPRPLSIPNQPPNPETPKLGEITKVDTSLVQPLNIIEDADLPEQKVEPEKPVDIPVPLVEDPNNPGILIQSTTPKQTSAQYKDKPVTVTNQGHVVKNPEVKTAETKGDGFYKYGDNIYQKKGDQWYKDVTGQGGFKLIEKDAEERTKELNTNARTLNYNQGGDYYVYNRNLYQKKGNTWYKEVKGDFIKLKEGNVAQRQAELNRNALPYRPGNKSYALELTESNVLKPNNVRIGDFNSYNALTAGGDKTIAAGMSFSSLTAPKIAAKDKMYNDDDTYNFNYDPNYAKASPENRAIIDAASKPAPKPTLPTVKLTTGLDLNAVKKSAEELTGPQYQQAFDNAANFAQKDLMTMFAEDNKLSKQQFTQLSKFQEEAKKIVGDGKYTPDKAKALADVMSSAENFFNTAKKANTFVNEAYSKDMSLSSYALELKKQEYLEQKNIKNNNDFQDATIKEFESTVKIADFIQENIDSGKIMYDRVNGGYKFSNQISETEKRYIEKNLLKMTSDYEKLQDQNYASVREEISGFKSDLSGVNAQINSLRKQAESLKPGDPRLKDINGQLYSLNKQKQLLEKRIDNKESLLSTVFKTEPQKLANSTGRNMSNSADAILSAIPSEFSPKDKFDFFYRELSATNDALAKANGIDEDYLSKVSRRFRDVLGWEGIADLSEAEREYLQNKAVLNKLTPLYYSNDFGITKSSAGFIESFMNSLTNMILPNTAAADGYFNRVELANTAKDFLLEKGFSEEDMMDDDAFKELEDATKVEFWSRENWGNMSGVTAGVIVPLVLTELVPGSAFKVANTVENLVTGTKNAQKAAEFVNRANNTFDAALSTTKFGKYILKPSVVQGVKFEAAGTLFESAEDELNFWNGLAGGIASNAFSKVIAKMAPTQAAAYIESIFGSSTPAAIKVIEKAGKAAIQGATEVVEESAQELTNIYTDELSARGLFDEVQARFGTLDEVEKFLTSAFIMGSAFELVSGSTAEEAYESLSDEKKARVNQIINAVKTDYNYAEQKTEDYVELQKRQNERLNKIEKEPEIKQELTESGDIQFDVEGIERTAEGKPSSVEVEESTFTEPVELFNTEGNDQENQQGVSSKVGEGEKPVEEQPVAKPGEEAPSSSGVVQGEQEQTQEVTTEKEKGRRPRTTKIAGAKEKEVVEEVKSEENDRRVNQIENKRNELLSKVVPTDQQNEVSNYPLLKDADGVKRYIPESIAKKAYDYYNKNVSDSQSFERVKERGGFSVEEMDNFYPNWRNEIPESQDINRRADAALERLNKQKETPATEPVGKTEELPAAETTGNPFEEISDANKLKGTAKTNAIKDLKKKYGADYNRISKIDTNFASIVKTLEKNNLINKDCG